MNLSRLVLPNHHYWSEESNLFLYKLGWAQNQWHKRKYTIQLTYMGNFLRQKVLEINSAWGNVNKISLLYCFPSLVKRSSFHDSRYFVINRFHCTYQILNLFQLQTTFTSPPPHLSKFLSSSLFCCLRVLLFVVFKVVNNFFLFFFR